MFPDFAFIIDLSIIFSVVQLSTYLQLLKFEGLMNLSFSAMLQGILLAWCSPGIYLSRIACGIRWSS